MPSRESQTDRQRIDVAGPTALGDAVAWARGYAADQRLAERDRARLCIIVEELVTNLCEHGDCCDQPIAIELAREGPTVGIAIEDNASPFDPRTAVTGTKIPLRGGGAGLDLVKSWSEIVGYETRGGRNRLEVRLGLSRA